MMAMKLSLSPHTLLESTSLAVAVVALSLSGFSTWNLRTHIQENQTEYETLKAQVRAVNSGKLVTQEEFQEAQTKVQSLNNDLWNTKESLKRLQSEFSTSQETLQNLQQKVEAYQQQIGALEAEKQTLSACIENIEPVARRMNTIPSYFLPSRNGWVWAVSAAFGAKETVTTAQEFNHTWNLDSGVCSGARLIASEN